MARNACTYSRMRGTGGRGDGPPRARGPPCSRGAPPAARVRGRRAGRAVGRSWRRRPSRLTFGDVAPGSELEGHSIEDRPIGIRRDRASGGRTVPEVQIQVERPPSSDVEAEVHHVAVLDHVVLALDAELARLAAARLAAELDEVAPVDHLGADEAALDVRVDLARGARRGDAARDRPGAALVGPRGEHADQADQLEGRADEAVPRGLGDAA